MGGIPSTRLAGAEAPPAPPRRKGPPGGRPKLASSYHRAIRRIARRRLFHGSQKQFPVGFVLKPQLGGYAHLPDEDIARVEEIIERYRPPDKISRREAVFMVADPEEIDSAGGYDDHIYVVEPIGEVEVSDLSWYTELSVYWIDMPEDEGRRLAEAYWSGEPFRDPARSLFEYRAREAEVVEEVDVDNQESDGVR